jgi:hypothetical protein
MPRRRGDVCCTSHRVRSNGALVLFDSLDGLVSRQQQFEHDR